METFQASHEKMTEDQIKDALSDMLKNHLYFKQRWYDSDWEEHEFDIFMEKQQKIIFKLRRHFYPKGYLTVRLSVKELADMMEYPKDEA